MECVNLHIGQAGCQIGSSIWELFCLEHGISPDGQISVSDPTTSEETSVFFYETESGKRIPRAIFVDLEPSVIDQIRGGQLFNPSYLISGKEDAANNYARGYYNKGREIIDDVMNCIRRQVESCSRMQGFIISHSLGGGTGSGFTALMMEHLTLEYGKKSKQDFIVYPAPLLSAAVVEPYNAVMTTHATLEHADCVFTFDNEALFDICLKKLDINKPSYDSLNHLISQVLSSATAYLRFPGPMNIGLKEFQINLVPYPRIHFPLVSYAPLTSPKTMAFEGLSAVELTQDCFRPTTQMLKCNPENGKCISYCLLFRGDVELSEMQEVTKYITSQRSRFVDWCPKSHNLGINAKPSTMVFSSNKMELSRALCALSSNTVIADVWATLRQKFDLLYSKRAFVHWYIAEGMEEGEFREAREDLAALEKEFRSVADSL